MGLACALGAEFNEVVVTLNEWDEPGQSDELAALVELLGVKADRLYE